MEHGIYLSIKELLARGWTKRLISLFLGTPDMTVPNPYRHGGCPKGLYLFTRIQEIEQSAVFGSEKSKSMRYSQRLAHGANTKTAQLTAIATEIALPELTLAISDLLVEASSRRNADSASRLSSEAEVALDILLDTMKSLEWHLDPFLWHPGIRHARKLLRSRILAHIIDHYPTLAAAAHERAGQDNGDPGEW